MVRRIHPMIRRLKRIPGECEGVTLSYNLDNGSPGESLSTRNKLSEKISQKEHLKERQTDRVEEVNLAVDST